MKFILLTLVALAVLKEGFGGSDIDWSNVKPIQEYAEFWGEEGLPDSYGVNKFLIGGAEAATHQFPFHVALFSRIEFGEALCSGSLISRELILTTASCITGAQSVLAVLGARDLENNLERYQARIEVPSSNVNIHPQYTRQFRNLAYDVGICRLPNRIAFLPAGVGIVNLPSPTDLTNNFVNTQTIMMGFGRCSQSSFEYCLVNRFAPTVTISNNLCQTNLNGITVIRPDHICTSGIMGRATCTGSLGAPLVIERNGGYVQIGIAAFYTRQCAQNDPSGFTRITHPAVYDWIMAHL